MKVLEEAGIDYYIVVGSSVGARFVSAVDVSAKAGAAPLGTPKALLERDARRRSRIDPEVAAADFLIHPELEYAAGPCRSYFVNARAMGERSARDVLPALVERLRLAGPTVRN